MSLTVKEVIHIFENSRLQSEFFIKDDVCEAYTAALGALYKQLPAKPNIYGDGYDDNGNLNYDTYDCPNCNTNYEIDYDGKYKFCPECGQKLDWSEENETD